VSVSVEDLSGCAAAHEVTGVASTVVVVGQPGVGFGLELTDGSEAASVEPGTPALLEDRGVEAFTDRVVVRRAGRRARVGELTLHQRSAEVAGDPFGPLSVSTPRTSMP
jgi:hypothetical protein